jgi:AraC-like DNA-binding protein
MKNNANIPVLDWKDCIHGTADFIIKAVEGTDAPARVRTPHRNSGFKIALLLDGKLNFYADFKEYTAVAPALVFLSPDQVHQHLGYDYHKVVYVSFSKDFLLNETKGTLSCWECMFAQVVIPVKEESDLKELRAYINLMQHEFVQLKHQKDIVIRNLLNAFIIAAARLGTCESNVVRLDSTQNKIVQQFKFLTDEHFVNRTQVAEYADMMYITPGYLNDTIKAATGRTAKQIIDEKRIVEAKRLLFWGEQSAKEIANHLNFEDDAYFNRFFKKHTGQTPAQFQKKYREKYN